MSSYWAERQAKAQSKLTTKSIKETEKQMRKYYEKSMEKTLDGFEKTYNKIFHSISEGKEITPADLYKLDKYWELQGQLQKELEKLGDKQIALLNNRFLNHYESIYKSIAMKGEPFFNTFDEGAAQQMINQIWCADGKSWSDRVWSNISRLQQTLNDELVNCVVVGSKPTVLKQKLMKDFNVSYYRADALVRTEMAHIQTQAAQQRYKEYGITEVEILADVDARTCDICAKLEGKRYSIYENIPIPAHTNCRCCIVPVVDDLKKEKNYDNIELKEYIDKPIEEIAGDNETVRKWYYANVHNIPSKIDATQPLEAQAKQALELRNQYKTQARGAMLDRATAETLESERPIPTLETLLKRKKIKYNLTGDEALRDIIRSASTTNPEVDDIFLKK